MRHRTITIDYKACWTLFIKYTPTTHIQREKECMWLPLCGCVTLESSHCTACAHHIKKNCSSNSRTEGPAVTITRRICIYIPILGLYRYRERQQHYIPIRSIDGKAESIQTAQTVTRIEGSKERDCLLCDGNLKAQMFDWAARFHKVAQQRWTLLLFVACVCMYTS